LQGLAEHRLHGGGLTFGRVVGQVLAEQALDCLALRLVVIGVNDGVDVGVQVMRSEGVDQHRQRHQEGTQRAQGAVEQQVDQANQQQRHAEIEQEAGKAGPAGHAAELLLAGPGHRFEPVETPQAAQFTNEMAQAERDEYGNDGHALNTDC
jgi:hypothetical protein